MIKLEDIKPGDTVVLKPMEVVWAEGGATQALRAKGAGGETHCFDAEDIAEHHPRPFKPGDEAIWDNIRVKILEIDGEVAWVRYASGERRFGCPRLSDLERLP